jgi:dUTP pyrophosphatase
MAEIKIKRLPHSEGLPLPEKATVNSSGFDLRAAVEKNIILKPFERYAVPTGFIVEIPQGFEGQIRTRSGLALKSGIVCLNSPGTIDADYRGEVKVILANLSNENFEIERGMRIAQLIITKIEEAKMIESEILSETRRGEGGFGHSGVM